MWSIGPRHTTGWSSRAKNPIEMRVTPLASGGTITSSMTVGGRSMPSMRGIEKPHTSASTAATLWPRCASATARFVVTDDLPTPPLPEAIASTRVRESVNGLVRAASAGPAAVAELLAEGLALAVGHHREVDVDRVDAGERDHRVGHPASDLGAERAAGDRERDRHPDVGALDRDPPEHVQVDDRAVQLRVLHGAQGFDDFGFTRHRGLSQAESGDFHYGDR